MRTSLILLAACVAVHLDAQPPQQPNALQSGLQLVTAGKFDSATLVFEKMVAARAPGAPRALQELVVLYAHANRLDDAHRALQQARTSGADYSGLAMREELAALRKDKRFAILFPDASVFADPFVEKTRIIHEWRGEKAHDEFGWIARPIGDVDNDRVVDVVISATMNPPAGATNGKVYVYSGKSGNLLWSREGERGWQLGVSLEAAGDVDKDGTPDVIAGAPGVRTVLIYSGRDGREIHRIRTDSIEASFGTAAAGIGDIDKDGHTDFIVGASGTSVKAQNAGRAIVFSGKSGTRLLVLDGEQAGQAFGSAVAGGAGRFLAVGAPGGPNQRGRVYIYDGLSATPRFTAHADSTGSALGAMFVTMAGDVDRDHLPDIFATDYTNRAKGPATGRVYVYSTATGKPVLTITGDSAGDTFGTSASYAGDVNGDGIADFAIGAWQYAGAAWSGGRVTVHSGKDGSVLQRITGKVPGETLGFDAVGVGDVDGDGATDFLITSGYSMVNGPRSGRVYIVAGTTRGK